MTNDLLLGQSTNTVN